MEFGDGVLSTLSTGGASSEEQADVITSPLHQNWMSK